jgi:uncharacterized membrane protein YuzA (DUF378 family)
MLDGEEGIAMWRQASGLTKTFLILSIIGAINWGLIGFFNFNLVDAIFRGGAREETSALARVIYAIVGLSGLGLLARLLASREGGAPSMRRPVTS